MKLCRTMLLLITQPPLLPLLPLPLLLTTVVTAAEAASAATAAAAAVDASDAAAGTAGHWQIGEWGPGGHADGLPANRTRIPWPGRFSAIRLRPFQRNVLHNCR